MTPDRPGPLQAAFSEAFARAEREAADGLGWLVRPAEERPRDIALFAVARLVVFSFDCDEALRLTSGFGWSGHLRALGLDPSHAFSRLYRDGSMVVAVWFPTCRTEGRPS